MDEEISKIISDLKNRIADLERKTDKDTSDVMRYIRNHCDEHLELLRMIYPAYWKTHPEYSDTMCQISKIIDKK